MKALSPIDQLFLLMEKRQQPMHVGGLMLFDFPENAGPKYITELAEHLREFKLPQAPFDKRLVTKMGQYYWEDDHHFDLEHHFRHEALPKPGRIRELLTRVSAEHSHLMDRKRPLWECHLIEGIRGRRFALYTKTHHAMIDGVSGMRMLIRALSTDPLERDKPPYWAMPPKQRKRSPVAGHPIMNNLAHLVSNTGKQLRSMPAVAYELAKSIRNNRHDPDAVSIFQAPQCLLNQTITGSRRFAAQSYAIGRIKRIAKIFDATVNDVVLAICGSALRDYLISQHALPDRPLIAMVPMSIRDDDSEGGNQVASILANLGTHISDPTQRLELIKKSVLDAKSRFAHMSKAEIMNYTAATMMPACFHLVTGLKPEWQTFNVVISNIPGPREHLYWNGAKLSGMYPVSIPLNRIALNITLFSYIDQLEFGLTACRRTMPSMQRLLAYIESAIKDLEIAAQV
jgi:diacylglycerol O-acyltransferase